VEWIVAIVLRKAQIRRLMGWTPRVSSNGLARMAKALCGLHTMAGLVYRSKSDQVKERHLEARTARGSDYVHADCGFHRSVWFAQPGRRNPLEGRQF